MRIRVKGLILATALLCACCLGGVAGAADVDRPLARGLQELPETTLGDMRGRYLAGSNTVLYFGVQMLSSWQMPDGRLLSGSALINIDFRGGSPVVSFTPTVSIVNTGPGGTLADTHARTIDSSGVANASGLVQNIQVTGDHNRVGNTLRLDVLGAVPSGAGGGSSGPDSAQTTSDGASARVALTSDGIGVTLALADQGLVRQLIRGNGAGMGSVLQSAAVLGDNHLITNQLQMTLVLQRLDPASLLRQSVAQSLSQMRGLDHP